MPENKKKGFRAGCVQFNVKKGDIKANLNKILHYLSDLASENADFALLPEMFSCSFDNERLSEHAGFSDEVIQTLCGLAQKNRMAIAGSLPEKEKDAVYNTMVFIDTDGNIRAKYRKAHLFRLTGENLYYNAGNQIVTAETSLAKAGLMICYDLRFPELARKLYLDGAQILLIPAQWPTPRKEHWETLARARAVENQLYVICTDRTGREDELDFPGCSMIISPSGDILAKGDDKEGVIFADIDLSLIDRVRAQIPCREDRRDDLYG